MRDAMKLSSKLDAKRLRVLSVVITLLAFAVALFISPQQIPVLIYKLAQVTIAAVVAYWIDKVLVPQIDVSTLVEQLNKVPEGSQDEIVGLIKASMIRRSIITVAVILGVCLGL